MSHRKTVLLSHIDLLNHVGADAPEPPIRLKSILDRIQRSPYHPLLDLSVERLAKREDLLLVHTQEYVDHVFSLEGKAAYLDHETPMSPGSVKAARLAAGLSLEMVERVLQGQVQSGFVLVRPPGHHARAGQGMGYCVFNNIAIAAMKALALGIQRILILDWDVHHGNGTQETFYEEDRVLFIDIHQENLFPAETGNANETGKGRGEGYTVNIPLPHSSEDADYLKILDEQVIPRARIFKPELILVSSGFDAHATDPKGSMSLSTEGYGELAKKVKSLAAECCGGKCILFLEGGYDPEELANNVLKVVEKWVGA